MKSLSTEFKIGVFVLIGLFLLGAILFRMDTLSLDQGQTIRVLFNFTGGLEQGAPVQLAGVPVGEVNEVNVIKDPQGRTVVEVVARVSSAVSVDDDAQIRIGTLGLLGTKYLEIQPGSGENLKAQDSEFYMGYDPVQVEAIAETGSRVAQKLETTVDAINKLLLDENFRQKVSTNVDDLSSLLKELRSATQSMNVILKKIERGEGLFGKLLHDESIFNNFSLLVEDLQKNPWKLLKKK